MCIYFTFSICIDERILTELQHCPAVIRILLRRALPVAFWTMIFVDLDTESPITSPREKSVAFGGYSPSVGGAMERPISAPSKRSVRFADELGFDELDLSLNDSRPSTAPGSGRSRMPNRLKDASIGSSFEDENMDLSLDLSTSDFRRSSTPTSTAVGMLHLRHCNI